MNMIDKHPSFKPVTERGYDPEPPKPDPKTFPTPVWTKAEESKLALYRAQVERHLRERNNGDAMQDLAAWKGDLHRVGSTV